MFPMHAVPPLQISFRPIPNTGPTSWEWSPWLTTSRQFDADNLQENPHAKPLPAFGDGEMHSASEMAVARRRE